MRYIFKKKWFRAAAAVLDAAGAFVFFPARLVTSGKKFAPPKHVLVVRLDHMGDILWATAVPKLLKDALPGCRVSVLTSSLGAELFLNNPFVEEVIIYNAPWFSREKKAGKGPRAGAGFWRTARKLKAMSIDTGLSLRGDARENALLFLARIPQRIGYGVTGGGFFLTRRPEYRRGVHETEHTLDILKAIGVSALALKGEVYFSTEEEKVFEKRLREWGLTRPIDAGIQLEAGNASKTWPLKNMSDFLELGARQLSSKTVIFVGTDAARAQILTEFLKRNPSLKWKNLVGGTSLRELLWLVRQCRVFVGADSGPTHAAALSGIPTLFLYSGTNVWGQWRSLEAKAEFLRHEVPCSPCQEAYCPVEGHPCMTGIQPEQVLNWMSEKSHAA